MADAKNTARAAEFTRMIQVSSKLPPEEGDQLRRLYFDQKMMPYWHELDQDDRQAITKFLPFAAESAYQYDVKKRGGDPTKPAQAGGGVEEPSMFLDPINFATGFAQGAAPGLVSRNPMVRQALLKGLNTGLDWQTFGLHRVPRWLGGRVGGAIGRMTGRAAPEVAAEQAAPPMSNFVQMPPGEGAAPRLKVRYGPRGIEIE